MSQTAPEPVRLTFQVFRDLLERNCPSRLPAFEAARKTLEEPDTSEEARLAKLKEVVGVEITTERLKGLDLYRWQGKSNPFQLEVPRPFEPNGSNPVERGPATPQAAAQASQESVETPPEGKDTPEAEQEAPSLDNRPKEPVRARGPMEKEERPAEAQPEPQLTTKAPATAQGLFAALAALLGDATLLMTVARTGEEDKEPVLTVTVVPQGEEAFSPVCLEGTVSELDHGFVGAVQSKAEGRKTLQEQVEALKAADKELEEAKKKEAEVKRQQAAAKNKAAEKAKKEAKEAKQEPEKAEAAPPPEPLKPEPQGALF